MTYSESGTPERAPVGRPVERSASVGEATWRFLGNRADADHAYCLRFDVSQAPEPTIALGGAWAYSLPSAESSR
jgi:hypothetical protein